MMLKYKCRVVFLVSLKWYVMVLLSYKKYWIVFKVLNVTSLLLEHLYA